jgi:hypothetical protein
MVTGWFPLNSPQGLWVSWTVFATCLIVTGWFPLNSPHGLWVSWTVFETCLIVTCWFPLNSPHGLWVSWTVLRRASSSQAGFHWTNHTDCGLAEPMLFIEVSAIDTEPELAVCPNRKPFSGYSPQELSSWSVSSTIYKSPLQGYDMTWAVHEDCSWW